jgi:hypothetical protein
VFVEAKEGNMVVFPSWLPHAVLPNQSAQIRTTIAFGRSAF